MKATMWAMSWSAIENDITNPDDKALIIAATTAVGANSGEPEYKAGWCSDITIDITDVAAFDAACEKHMVEYAKGN